jgi:hypothetical protein
MNIKTQTNHAADVAFLKRMLAGLVAGTILCASGLFASIYEGQQEELGARIARAPLSSN